MTVARLKMQPSNLYSKHQFRLQYILLGLDNKSIIDKNYFQDKITCRRSEIILSNPQESGICSISIFTPNSIEMFARFVSPWGRFPLSGITPRPSLSLRAQCFATERRCFSQNSFLRQQKSPSEAPFDTTQSQARNNTSM